MSFINSFKQPDRKYSANNLWFWNKNLEPEILKEQIREMVDKGVYNAFMHPRAYLKTPYLEKEWWEAIDACIEESEKQGFFPWLYDEYAWPSGTAGSTFDYGYQKPSIVLSKSNDYIAKSIYNLFFDVNSAQDLSEKIKAENNLPVAMYIMEGECFSRINTCKDITSAAKVMAFFRRYNKANVDYLNEEAIAYFIQVTHEEYKKRYGNKFGKLIPGIFFDEIFMLSQPLPWTDKLPTIFEQRHGYDLLDFLPCLMLEGNEYAKKVRTDYYETTSALYENAFFKQIGAWCTKNNLKLTGHTEENLARHPARQGSYFDTMKHLHIPGADNHDYRYRFPRKITYCESKYSVSVSRVNGYETAMSEAMGGAGWGCTLQTFRRGINTMAALGISMFTLHGFYYSCDKQGSQGDWPTSFFYQNPYWKYFKAFADYISRICYINSVGTPKVDVGLFYPVNEIRKDAVAGHVNEEGQALNDYYHQILDTLIENQIDVDFIDKANILKASVVNGRLCIGKEAFSILVFPNTLILDNALEKKLNEFVCQGGKLFFYSVLKGKKLGGAFSNYESLSAQNICIGIMTDCEPDIIVERGNRADFFASRRDIEGHDVFFLTNSSPETREYTIKLKALGNVSILDPETGMEHGISFTRENSYTKIHLKFEEDQAVFVVFNSACVQKETPLNRTVQLAVPGRWTFLPAKNSEKPIETWENGTSDLHIPVAQFSSDLHKDSRRIRIKNSECEQGGCGRHLSLWNAAFITRRTAWSDDSVKKDLYFRKVVELNTDAKAAKLCIAAINEYTLYINGKAVKHSLSNGTPETLEVANFLTPGKNLIAVHVHNETCLKRHELNSIDYLPKERLISLLLEGYIDDGITTAKIESNESFIVCDTLQPNWNTLEADYEKTAQAINHASCSNIVRFDRNGLWVHAWSRGTLPLHPWGDMPLFNKTYAFPIQIAYTVTLPAGTKWIHKPLVQGKCTYMLDSLPIKFNNASYEITPDANTHILSIQITAHCKEDGLKEPVRVTLVPYETSLCDWRLQGLDWFSGDGIYKIDTDVDKRSGRYFLDLGKVAFQARVYVNGQDAGTRIWAPYRFDITELLVNGSNEIIICVSNSAAVERQFMLVDEGRALGWDVYWNSDNIHREGENLVSGLLGTVVIERYCKQTSDVSLQLNT